MATVVIFMVRGSECLRLYPPSENDFIPDPELAAKLVKNATCFIGYTECGRSGHLEEKFVVTSRDGDAEFFDVGTEEDEFGPIVSVFDKEETGSLLVLPA